jgi:AbrB family looped-hinge helix DNA binding protein
MLSHWKKEIIALRQTLIVSHRGQLTLPANLRKRFGIKNGGAIILEERGNELVLKPAMVLEVEMYTDEQVLAWDEADRLDDAERQTVLRHLAARQ